MLFSLTETHILTKICKFITRWLLGAVKIKKFLLIAGITNWNWIKFGAGFLLVFVERVYPQKTSCSDIARVGSGCRSAGWLGTTDTRWVFWVLLGCLIPAVVCGRWSPLWHEKAEVLDCVCRYSGCSDVVHVGGRWSVGAGRLGDWRRQIRSSTQLHSSETTRFFDIQQCRWSCTLNSQELHCSRVCMRNFIRLCLCLTPERRILQIPKMTLHVSVGTGGPVVGQASRSQLLYSAETRNALWWTNWLAVQCSKFIANIIPTYTLMEVKVVRSAYSSLSRVCAIWAHDSRKWKVRISWKCTLWLVQLVVLVLCQNEMWRSWDAIRFRQKVAFNSRMESSTLVRILQGGHKPGKPGILGDFSEHGKLREFSVNSVQPQGKIVTNIIFLGRHSSICVKQLLTG